MKKIIRNFMFAIIFMFLGSITTYLYMINNKQVYEDDSFKRKNNSTLSMMLETEANSRTYIQSTDTKWSTDGYAFNEEMSKCEQGSKLYWDDTNKKVVMEGNVSDKCYVFFDKYNLASITDITTSSTTNTITATINVKAGQNSISKYFFSINDGEWIENASATYTFKDLSMNTMYKIKAKCLDSQGKYSYVFSKEVQTTSFNNPSITNYSITPNGKSISISITAKAGTKAISKYYYSKDNGTTYVSSTSSNYTFSELSKGIYNIKAYVEDTDGNKSNIVSKNISITNITLATWIKNQYTGTQGENGIYYHNSSLTNGAGDNSYRYGGSDSVVKNYICFGSYEATCPDNYVFRIIGVFGNQVKIVKDDSLGAKYWNSRRSNSWSLSSLNTYLNETYISNLSSWGNRIASTTWIVGGNSIDNIANSNAKTAYQNEIVNPVTTNSEDGLMKYTAKIGLIYVSDYAFAADISYWTKNVADYDYRNNWLNLSQEVWTLTRKSDGRAQAFYTDLGRLKADDVDLTIHVHPTFYLSSSTEYYSGTGTASDPIRVDTTR